MKILLLIPDGVGVRNFLYTDFINIAISSGHHLVVWADDEILRLVEDYRVQKLLMPKLPPTNIWSEILRYSWSVGLLKWQAKHFNNDTYLNYIFKRKASNFSSAAKKLVQDILIRTHREKSRIAKLRDRYLNNISRLPYFEKCLEQLQKQKADFVLCAVQRSSKAIGPLLAAIKLNIKNATFIYSWDNLSKASLYVKASNYFVWSNQMKEELIMYHPEISESNIHITGTPQFTPYFDDSLKLSRNNFALKFNLPENKKWICFSGDDISTSPLDQVYLSHLAQAVVDWNSSRTDKLHIIFRRCPVDTSNRYDDVLQDFRDVITDVKPAWESVVFNSGWDKIVPKKEDMMLLVNTVLHCEAVVNIGSTMAHDFSIYNKPTIYINYNIADNSWDVKRIYKFIHFNTMVGLDPVIWINDRTQWKQCLNSALFNSKNTVEACKIWHNRVAQFPLEESNARLLTTIESLCKNKKETNE